MAAPAVTGTLRAPWFKHWRDGIPTPPRRAHSRALAYRTYAIAAAELGAEHPATRAAHGRYLAHTEWSTPTFAGTIAGPGAVAFARESGRSPGHWNRSRRRHFDRVLRNALENMNSAGSATHLGGLLGAGT